VFDVAALRAFLERVGAKRIPVLAAVTPLESFRHAEFMANEVPGVMVPAEILERMRLADEAGRAREEGLAIASDLVGELAGSVQGLQLSVPAGSFDTAVQLLERV
jgi:homocysteine S-methyltransferase